MLSELKKTGLYFYFVLDIRPWHLFLISVPDIYSWYPSLTFILNIRSWHLFLISFPDIYPWYPSLRSILDIRPWHQLLISVPDIYSWYSFLTFILDIHSWHLSFISVPDIYPWCPTLTSILDIRPWGLSWQIPIQFTEFNWIFKPQLNLSKNILLYVYCRRRTNLTSNSHQTIRSFFIIIYRCSLRRDIYNLTTLDDTKKRTWQNRQENTSNPL